MITPGGTPLVGRDGMPALSIQVSKDKEWQNLDPEEKAWMQKGLQERKAMNSSAHKPVHINTVIENFSSRLDTEVHPHITIICSTHQHVPGSNGG